MSNSDAFHADLVRLASVKHALEELAKQKDDIEARLITAMKKAHLGVGSTTVDGESRMDLASPRIEGSFSPGASSRVETLRRIASMTAAVRVPPSDAASASIVSPTVRPRRAIQFGTNRM